MHVLSRAALPALALTVALALTTLPAAWAASPGARIVTPGSATAKGHSYIGEFSGGHIGFVVSKDGRQVKRAFVKYRFTCDDGEVFPGIDEFPTFPMSATGKFTASYDTGVIPSPVVDGATVHFTGSVSGRRNKARTKIVGTGSFTMVVTLPAGEVINCSTGLLRYQALD